MLSRLCFVEKRSDRGEPARERDPAAAPGINLDRVTPLMVADPAAVYRAAVLLDENRTLFTLQALTKARDAHNVRVESTKLKDYDIES